MTRVQFTFVDTAHPPEDVWVEMDSIPRVDDVVNIPGVEQYETVVRTVVWNPLGDPDEDEVEPWVYVVLGRRRRDGL